MHRIAIDIGGTFTDVALELNRDQTRLISAKTLTTPKNPVVGTMVGIQLTP